MMTLEDLREYANEATPDRDAVAELIVDELIERGWTTRDMAARMGGQDAEERAVDELTIDFTIANSDSDVRRQVIFTEELSGKIARAFGTSSDLWSNLHRRWKERQHS